MHSLSLLLLVALATAAYAAGQYYVPRSYYVIDAEGRESEPVPLRRLRRSLGSRPHPHLQRPHTRESRAAHGRYLSAHGDWRTMSANYGGPIPVRKP